MSPSRLPSSTAGGNLSGRNRSAFATASKANDEPHSGGDATVEYDFIEAPARHAPVLRATDPLTSLPLSLPLAVSTTLNDTDAVRLIEAARHFARVGEAEVHASEMLSVMQRRIPFPRLRELLELSASDRREPGVHTSSMGIHNGGSPPSTQQSLFWVDASSSLPDLGETELAALAREFLVVDAEPTADSHSRLEHEDHVVRVRQEVNTTPPWYFATTPRSTDHHYPPSDSGLYASAPGLLAEPHHGEQSWAPGMTPELRNVFGASSRAFYFGGPLPVGPAPSRILATTAPIFQSPLPAAPSSYRAPSLKNKQRHHGPGKLTRKPGKCTHPGCDVTESTIWRTHPETKAQLCNSCGQKIRALFKSKK
ncbi:hypothetical protein R3P38DRAFT_894983 [Favolaschia claudopus]|uniref:GATA-type domain-containing protein n=1 Tax=Favolaschia claudopus TaxID=2862362 RepID=A0AAW0BTQ0_9AGAR